jgi:hypothetical protein
MSRLLGVALALALAFPAAASAHELHRHAPVLAAAAPAQCPGDPIAPTHVITGEFSTEQEGGYVFVPFDVPAGATAVRVKYCHDQPEAPTSAQLRHTLDLGLYEPRRGGAAVFGPESFRGWGGSSHPDVTVSAEGFSSEEQYRASPRGHVPGRTTRGFLPGPVPAGRWAVELGVAAVMGQLEGDADGRVGWRVEVELSSDPAFADEPYAAAPYDSSPARSEPGWYAGDMHVHAEHSALGDATMTEAFDYAFAPPGQGAGLDFVTLSDYVAGSSWGEVGRYQARYPGKLIMRSAEVITYRGHTNSHNAPTHVDYRTGPLYERRDDGSLALVREAVGPRGIFEATHAAGGFTQVNHPTIFPSEVPGFASFCRGCPWDYSDAETGWSGGVDAYEVHTGPAGLPQPSGNEPGPNPFTLTAIEEFDRLRRLGHRVTAVAVSDSHNARRASNPVTQSPIGEGTTVVRADELSSDGIAAGVRAGHAYVKLFGSDSPDLRLEAVGEGGRRAIMGDPLPGDRAEFTVRVIGGVASAPRTLVVLRDGSPIDTVPVTGGGSEFTHRFTATRQGDYRVQVMRGTAVDALTNPITLGASPGAGGGGGDGQAGGGAGGRRRMRATVSPSRVRAGRRTRFTFRVRAAGRPLRGARVRFAGGRAVTGRRGRASLVRRLRRRGVRRARVSRAGYRTATARVRVLRAPRFTG